MISSSVATLDKTLRNCPLFHGLNKNALLEVASICGTISCSRGELLYFEGQAARHFYIVASGKIKIFKSNRNGKEKILHVCGRTDSFAEVPVFDRGDYPASAAAIEDSELISIARDAFIELLSTQPDLSLNMLANLALKLRHFTSQIEHLTLKDVPERIASHIIYLAEKHSTDAEIYLEMPKGQLANLLGTTPETLSRVLSRFEAEGLIKINGRAIKVIDLEALNATDN